MSSITLSLDLTKQAIYDNNPSLNPSFTVFTLSQVDDNEATRQAVYQLVREGVLMTLGIGRVTLRVIQILWKRSILRVTGNKERRHF